MRIIVIYWIHDVIDILMNDMSDCDEDYNVSQWDSSNDVQYSWKNWNDYN